MAAVYSSLLSLIKVINLTENHPLPLTYLKKLQTQPLLDQVNFLLEFVEEFSHYTKRSQEIELLDSRITVAAHKAEYIIEIFVVDQIKRRNSVGSSIVVDMSCENLEKVVQEMNLIKDEVLKIQADYKEKAKHLMEAASGSLSINARPIPPPPPPFGGKKNTMKNMMMGFDDDLLNLKEKLTSDKKSRLVIPIVGMGGIGKTTIATNTYNDPYIKSCFDIRAWVTISQNFSLRNTLLTLLNETDSNDISDQELGVKLHKFLFGRKYLVVLDDIWSVTAWDEISKFLPDDGNRSRIMITTRLSVSALSLGSLNPYEMKFLDHDMSWNLLSAKVFDRHGDKVCPSELEEIGREIAKKCGGLPLAIVVIGGLLKVSHKTREYWSEVAGNVSSMANKENDDQCLKILSLSYDQLPIHLKPLFIYMAIFPEDSQVKVSRLVNLWVAEGFIKPPTDVNKTLEEVAKGYLMDLCDRNLVMVKSRSYSGNTKTCRIHDLLRDVCLREAHKGRFICVLKKDEDITVNISNEYRLGLHPASNHENDPIDFPSRPSVRTVVGEDVLISSDVILCFDLLRVLHVDDDHRINKILTLVNARYLAFSILEKSEMFLHWPWNLESVFVEDIKYKGITLPSEIWQMQQLRHVESSADLYMTNSDEETNKYCVLNNLQSLSNLADFKVTDDIIDRIPNLKKLSLVYHDIFDPEEVIKSIHNLARLQKLEILKLRLNSSMYFNLKKLYFPVTLRKLVLRNTRIPWENMNIIGSLPKLEMLNLEYASFLGTQWNPIEGEFQCLKTLKIENSDLEMWEVEGIHFPALENLFLYMMSSLKEIPWGIREIPALKLIQLKLCKNSSLVISAKEMLLEVQDEEGNDELLIKVITQYLDAEILALTSHNFQVESQISKRRRRKKGKFMTVQGNRRKSIQFW